jgi:plasmid stability protein
MISIGGTALAAITIRNLDEAIKTRLRIQAASHNRSMEEEARVILGNALHTDGRERGLGTLIHKRFLAEGGIELPPTRRTQPARKPDSLE